MKHTQSTHKLHPNAKTFMFPSPEIAKEPALGHDVSSLMHSAIDTHPPFMPSFASQPPLSFASPYSHSLTHSGMKSQLNCIPDPGLLSSYFASFIDGRLVSWNEHINTDYYSHLRPRHVDYDGQTTGWMGKSEPDPVDPHDLWFGIDKQKREKYQSVMLRAQKYERDIADISEELCRRLAWNAVSEGDVRMWSRGRSRDIRIQITREKYEREMMWISK